MSKALHIAEGFSLPLELVTQTVAVLAKRRAGKSYLLARMVEELFAAGEQVVVVDPKGDWWGLRSSADGKKEGLSILILGGEHGDLKLAPGSGETVARMIVEERVSALLDLSEFRKSEVASFATGFLETLYRLKAKEEFRTAMALVIDEADAIAPQRPQHGEERMLGAAEDIVRRGGQRGIGCFMATQRAAVLNKNVLTQAQVLIALRTIAPQDLAAMNAWIDVHGTPEQRAKLMESLPALPVGTAWVWSPGWPTERGIFQCVKVSARTTFDSGATPKSGEVRRAPKTFADVDLAAVEKRMADAIEKQKADDPKLLRKRIAELEREVAKKPAAVPVRPHDAAVARLVDADLTQLRRLLRRVVNDWSIAHNRALDSLFVCKRAIDELDGELETRAAAAPSPPARPPREPLNASGRSTPTSGGSRLNGSVTGRRDGQVPGGELQEVDRRILTALAQYPQGRSRPQVLVLARYSDTGTFRQSLARLRASGWIIGSSDGFRITDDGRAVLGSWDELPTGRDLAEHWFRKLDEAPARILRTLFELDGGTLKRPELLEKTNYSDTGTFRQALALLRRLELIDGNSSGFSASTELYS
jgi:hypothetical protein